MEVADTVYPSQWRLQKIVASLSCLRIVQEDSEHKGLKGHQSYVMYQLCDIDS